MDIKEKTNVKIECAEGWNGLIEPILDYINEYNGKVDNENEKILVAQIKEKFGGLRIYVHNAPEKLKNMISKAEKKSYKVCELCGSKDDIGQTTGWITTCCRKCVNELAKKEKRNLKWYSTNNKKFEIIKYEE